MSDASWPEPPPLPPGRTVLVPGRGELFVRDTGGGGPTIVLLHGWTATGELNWFLQWQEVARLGRVVLIDHRGHGRGIRSTRRFSLEDCADDIGGLCGVLGIERPVLVGYSMGGPIAVLTAQRHPRLVGGIVLAATAMEWRATLLDRLGWVAQLPAMSFALRTGLARRGLRVLLQRAAAADPSLAPYVEWAAGEAARGSTAELLAAGRALSRYDARSLVPELGVPGEVIVTSRDRLVPPRKQRAQAAALGADPIEVRADHDATVVAGAAIAAAVVTAVDRLLGSHEITGIA
ncbi:MAG: alpha/beta hydrolase [Actinomycetota bacterium]